MNEFYTKLDYKIPDHDWSNSGINVDVEYSNYPKLTYFNITDHASNLICSCFPREIFNQGHYEIKLFIIEGKGVVHPHTDYDIRCAINYYFEPNRSVTIWYEPKSDIAPEIFDNDRYIIYDHNDLEPVGAFLAEKGSVYLLNNSKVHSVVHYSPMARKMIQIQWYETDYSNIQKILLNDFGKN